MHPAGDACACSAGTRGCSAGAPQRSRPVLSPRTQPLGWPHQRCPAAAVERDESVTWPCKWHSGQVKGRRPPPPKQSLVNCPGTAHTPACNVGTRLLRQPLSTRRKKQRSAAACMPFQSRRPSSQQATCKRGALATPPRQQPESGARCAAGRRRREGPTLPCRRADRWAVWLAGVSAPRGE
jgi:hypothetical protein